MEKEPSTPSDSGDEPWNREYPNLDYTGVRETGKTSSLLVSLLTGCGFTMLIIVSIVFFLAAVCFSVIR